MDHLALEVSDQDRAPRFGDGHIVEFSWETT
jgi:hypothetical protein